MQNFPELGSYEWWVDLAIPVFDTFVIGLSAIVLTCYLSRAENRRREKELRKDFVEILEAYIVDSVSIPEDAHESYVADVHRRSSSRIKLAAENCGQNSMDVVAWIERQRELLLRFRENPVNSRKVYFRDWEQLTRDQLRPWILSKRSLPNKDFAVMAVG